MPNSKHWKTFGCAVFFLAGLFKTGNNIIHKWKKRSKVVIYIGLSSFNARNETLLLDQVTGNVSLQYQISYDPVFHTVKQYYYDSLWAVKSIFMNQIGEMGLKNYQENQNEGGNP